MTHGEHATEIVVNCSGKDASKDNPQVGCRSELSTHDGTKDGARSRNVQELNHKHLPVGKNDVVQAVSLSHSRSNTVVRAKHVGHKSTIKQITQNKSNEAQRKCNHF